MTAHRPMSPRAERGASAVLLAASATLLFGMAAIAIDIGLGFNERRVDQAAADTAVMAGAVSFTIPAQSNDNRVATEVLAMARANLKNTFTEAEWRAMWVSCSDPERAAWDPGTGVPIALTPLPVPTSWTTTAPIYPAATTIDCISKSSSYLRVKIPSQQTETVFAKIFGASSLTTSADAVAEVKPGSGGSPLMPLGIVGGAAAGELCLTTSGSGTAFPPCAGPSSGSFGPVNSEIFYDYFTTPLAQCANPGGPELAQNLALGIDHLVALWSKPLVGPGSGVVPGAAHPGDVAVEGYTGVTHDQCRFVGGVRVEQVAGETFPVNMLRVSTGFPANDVESGLVWNLAFNYVEGGTAKTKPALLQQDLVVGFPTRNLTQKIGPANVTRTLNNRGPWVYLDFPRIAAEPLLPGPPPVHPFPKCLAAEYADGTPTANKLAAFDLCLEQFEAFAGTSTTVLPIITDGILDSSRFAWAPQYWHAASTSGLSWQPVHRYRMIYIGGLYFDCSGVVCDFVYYPDGDDPMIAQPAICVPQGPFCKDLSISQLSGWLLPSNAVSETVRASYPGAITPNTASLFR